MAIELKDFVTQRRGDTLQAYGRGDSNADGRGDSNAIGEGESTHSSGSLDTLQAPIRSATEGRDPMLLNQQ